MSETRKNESGVVEKLQQQLANAFVLYTNYKKYHWESYGPLFRDLHLLFDEHATVVLNTIDELGERVRILGGNPVSDPRQFGEISAVTIAAGEMSLSEMILQALQNHRKVIQEHREAIDTATSAGDPGTADLLTRNIQLHEKQEWFLRQVLEKSGAVLN